MARRYFVREWLDDTSYCDGEYIRAFVSKAVVPKTVKQAKQNILDVEAFIDIASSSRHTSIDFGDWKTRSPKERTNSLKKIDKLIQVLCQFRKHLNEEYKNVELARTTQKKILKG